MFRVCKQASVEFNAQSLDKKGKRISTGTQTDARTSKDKEVQSLTSKDESIQANLERCLTVGKPNFNPKKLVRFLNDAAALTISEIEESLAIEASLRHIDLMSKDDEELTCNFYYSSIKSNKSSDETVRSLKNGGEQRDDQNKEKSKLSIEHLTFSCNLNQLVMAYSVREHSYWCTHKSRIEFCNLYQTSDKRPNLLKTIFQVEVNNCVTALISHPTQFGQVAAGTKAGSVLVVDRELATGSRLSSTDSSTESSGIIQAESNLHKLEITFLSFKRSLESHYSPDSMQATSSQTNRESTRIDELISASLDGKIVIWKIKQLERQLQPVRVLSLGKQQLLKQVQLGIRCAVLSPEQDSLLIGCENVLFSTILSKRNAELNVDFEYESHRGEIVAIEFGASKRFLTNGKDHEIRLYEVNLRKPLLTIYLDANHSNYRWVNDDQSSAALDERASNRKQNTKSSNCHLIGLHESNLYIVNIYKKDAYYFSASQCYPLRQPFGRLFLSRSNQLALVNDDEIRVFDYLNVLMR